MAGDHGHGTVQKKKPTLLAAAVLWLHHHLYGFEFLGLIGYGIEWILELSHINSWLHHRLHGNRAAKFGLVAIAAIMVGHLTEHFHQEQGQDADQAKFKKLEDRILVLEETLRENEMQKAKPSNA